tara:strand:+ start:84 stop:866 length:783 start_codon:yes stop_codon:yes gene_type:complete
MHHAVNSHTSGGKTSPGRVAVNRNRKPVSSKGREMKKLYSLQSQPLVDLAKMIKGLIESSNRDIGTLCDRVQEVLTHSKKSKKIDLPSLKDEIGRIIAPMNDGKPVKARMVEHFAKIGEVFTSESIKAFGECGSVKSFRFLASAKGLSDTLKNEIVVAIGKAGGVYSDLDFKALAEFAKENKTLSARQIVEKRGPGCGKDSKRNEGPTPHSEAFEALGKLFTARTGKVAQNEAELSKYLVNTVIPEAEQWAAQEEAEAAK